jgi:hypothetical protein
MIGRSVVPDSGEATEYASLAREVRRSGEMADALRRRIYGPGIDGVADSDSLWAELAASESALRDALAAQGRVSRESSAGLILSAGTAAKDGTLGRDTTGLQVDVQLRMERVPTSVVHLLDPGDQPLTTTRVRNASGRPRRVRVTCSVEGYSASAVATMEVPPRETATAHQLPTFFPDRLRQVTELTRATLHVAVDDLDGNQETHTTARLWLLARNTACLQVTDPATGAQVDLTRYLAAWVTPHEETVLRALRAAADHHPQRSIAGYQGDAEFVDTQIEAMYAALKASEITYINSVICFGQAHDESMQKVRLPRESLGERSANCIDGTVLFASLAEAASLNPGIVLVPGHAFLAWQPEQGGRWDYLETTMIADHTFGEAQAMGRKLASINGSLNDDTGRPLLDIVSLAEARVVHGVVPIE